MPSYSTSTPTGIDDVAGSQAWSDLLLGSGLGEMMCTGGSSGVGIAAGPTRTIVGQACLTPLIQAHSNRTHTGSGLGSL